MQVYDAIGNCPDGLRTFLNECCERWQRPIRIVNGGGRTFTEEYAFRRAPWDHIARDPHFAGDLDFETVKATGLTIVWWSTTHTTPDYGQIPVHDALFTDPEAGERWRNETGYNQFYDAIISPERLFLGEHIEIEGVKFGELLDRMLLMYLYSPNNLAYEAPVDWVKLIGAPLERTFDPEFVERIQEQRKDYNLRRFETYFKETSDEGLKQTRGRIATLENQYAQGVQTAANAKAKLRDEQRFIDALMQKLAEDGDNTDYEEQWRKVESHPLITSIDFQDQQTIVLETKSTDLKHPTDDRSVEIGPFRWTINLDTSEINVRNIGNPRGGFDHPHVNQGRPCFGEMGNTIHSLITTGQLEGAIGMVFVFLSSINLRDDWSRRASWWFDDDQGPAREATLVGAINFDEPDEYDDYPDDDPFDE